MPVPSLCLWIRLSIAWWIRTAPLDPAWRSSRFRLPRESTRSEALRAGSILREDVRQAAKTGRRSRKPVSLWQKDDLREKRAILRSEHLRSGPRAAATAGPTDPTRRFDSDSFRVQPGFAADND